GRHEDYESCAEQQPCKFERHRDHLMFKVLAESDGIVASFTRADTDGLFDVVNEDLAVADLAGVGGLGDGLDRLLKCAVLDDDFHLQLGQEVHDVFSAAVELGMSLLATKSFHLRNSN